MSFATTPLERLPTAQIAPGTHHQRLSQLRDQEQQRRLTVVALSSVALVILLLLVLAIADYHLETPTTVRVIGWGLISAIVVAMVVRFHSWMKFEATKALANVERSWPELGQRLRTSHDYQTNASSVSPADPELICALESETQQRVTSRKLAPLGSQWPIISLLGLCTFAILVWAAALVAIPEWRLATARLFLLPVHYSDVQMDRIPAAVPFGDDLVVQLHVAGRPLQSALVRYRVAGTADWSESAMQPGDGSDLTDKLTAIVRDCRDDLELQVTAGPFDSGIQSVIVRIPLVLQSWTATVEPPIYTGLPSTTGTPAGLRIPEGSTLTLAATYNRPPTELDVDISPQAAAAAQTSINANIASILVNLHAQPLDLSIRGRTADGMTDESTLHINVVPDQRPALKFVTPDETSEAIPTAEVRFTLNASDDFGLNHVGIRYRIDDGPEQILWEKPSDENSTAVAQTTTLGLEDLDIAYPQAITYYAYAIDNRNPEPQRVTSELRFIDIRPFSREYEFSDKNSSTNCQGECLSLEKLVKEQRGILGRTFSVVQQGTTVAEAGTKLADEERQLREKTQALTDALLEKVGPMPSLIASLQAMSGAIDDLAHAAMAAGQAHEERALAELIAARQNLRKILKQSDPKAQMCRNVDQQQLDKLRKPEQKQAQKEEQQLVSIRKNLEQMAKQQQSFCQSAKACDKLGESSSSSKSDGGNNAERSELAKQQQQSAAEAKAIENELQSSEFGSLAPKRLAEVAESISQSGKLISQGKDDSKSIALATEAAQRLQQLSKHLARRHDPDFSKKLAAAGRQAEKLAAEQSNLSEQIHDESSKNPRVGGDEVKTLQQEQLAGSGEELADVVDQLLAEATNQDWQIQRALAEQTAAAAPRQAVEKMQEAAKSLAQDQTASTSTSGRQASDILKRFAAGVKQVEQTMAPVRLAELQKAEMLVASLRKELRRADTLAEQAMVNTGVRQFVESIAPLARNDRALAEALESLPRLASASEVSDEGLRKVDEVLQQRIQEAILSGAMQQTVGAVPPQYTDMVEEYYRVLSEDIE